MTEPEPGLQIMVALTEEHGAAINTIENFPSPEQLVREAARRHANRVGDLWITLPLMGIGIASATFGIMEVIESKHLLSESLVILQIVAGAGCAAGGLWVSLKSTAQNHFYARVMHAAEVPNQPIPYNPK